ncbi:sulfotransferase family protein [Mycobacterium shigaense]|nr:sulfotransferase family protein [Mycobacterium shigaense]MEA1123028.1 sulfotransferase family protein [Mycobacterium shigaense]PRI13410.1 sulfotransferase family protein [Mycobacterium shigaense]
MPRSGTSALTRVLSLSGAALPTGMLGAGSGNTRGYWEPRKVLRLNNSILLRRGSGTYDPSLRLQGENALSADEKAACISDIRAYLASLPKQPLIVIKDLQITALSELWFEAARDAGLGIAAVVAVRHPGEVSASLANLMGARPELTSALWLKYNLLAERHTRHLPRVFVEYGSLLKDPQQEIERIAKTLAVDLSTPDHEAIGEFLEEDLRHHRQSGPVPEICGAEWVSTTYDALQAAAADEPVDEFALDRVFDAYRASEHDFRTAFEDSYRHSNNLFVRLCRPFIWNLVEVVALLKRRRGTWA